MATNFEVFEDSELTNDIVAVSRLQVALRAEARSLQTAFSEVALSVDTTSSEGLFQLLQQAASLLLEYSKYWTHVLASSQTVYGREAAETLFNQFSLQERGKFSVESLANANGVITHKEITPPRPDEKAAYIVVTLLLGTADDQPLFGEIYSTSVLRDVLQEITLMPARYLMALEVLWTPQETWDSLTDAELASEYADLIPIG